MATATFRLTASRTPWGVLLGATLLHLCALAWISVPETPRPALAPGRGVLEAQLVMPTPAPVSRAPSVVAREPSPVAQPRLPARKPASAPVPPVAHTVASRVPAPKPLAEPRVSPAPKVSPEQRPSPAPKASPQPLAPAAPPPEAAVVPARFDAGYLRNPAPVYPRLARRRHEEGRVLLQVTVSARGTPQTVRLYRSSGHNALDRAAVDAVKRWRFEPARRGEKAIRSDVLVPIAFTLR